MTTQDKPDFIEWLYDGPTGWSRKQRRIYVALCPITVPLLLATQLLGCLVLGILALVVFPVGWLHDLWNKQ